MGVLIYWIIYIRDNQYCYPLRSLGLLMGQPFICPYFGSVFWHGGTPQIIQDSMGFSTNQPSGDQNVRTQLGGAAPHLLQPKGLGLRSSSCLLRKWEDPSAEAGIWPWRIVILPATMMFLPSENCVFTIKSVDFTKQHCDLTIKYVDVTIKHGDLTLI